MSNEDVCINNNCTIDEICVPDPKNCITTPCPQYKCEKKDTDTDKDTYSYGIPAWLIYLTHIFIGLFLGYLGWRVVNKKYMNPWIGWVLFSLGVLALSYHSHLWIF